MEHQEGNYNIVILANFVKFELHISMQASNNNLSSWIDINSGKCYLIQLIDNLKRCSI